MRIVVPCPAKVNLFLAVGPVDERGYHPLRTIFQAISLYDELVIDDLRTTGSWAEEDGTLRTPSPFPGMGRGQVVGQSGIRTPSLTPVGEGAGDGEFGSPSPQRGEGPTENRIPKTENPTFTTNSPEVPPENTVTKTLQLIQEVADLPPLHIHLEKRIPAQSGLGGGSSDAAGLLRAIDHFLPQPLSQEAKLEIATKVGMDVPFFVFGGRAKATGYGEILEPLPDLARKWLVVVRPEVGVSTKEAYQALDAAPYPWRDFPEDPWTLYNDFERVAPCACGELAERLQILGAEGAILSGSGSAVFGLFSAEQTAQAAATQLPGSWLCHTLTRAESLRTPSPQRGEGAGGGELRHLNP